MATDLGHNSASQTHSGLPQCDSKPVISAEPAHHDRVESQPRSRESDIQAVGNSSSGHVCHSPQHASSPVCVSSSGAWSTGDRCPIIGLAGEVDVHVSTVSPAKPSYSEAQDQSDGRGDTHSPPWWPSQPWTTHPSFHTAETCCHNRDMSRIPSTNRMYDGRWLRFANWATGNGVDPLCPTAAKKAAFLYELFDTRGLSPQTIKGYRFCLASVLSHTGKAAAVQAKTISDMSMSMELQRPRFTSVLPQWDIGIVLEALCSLLMNL